MGFKHKKEKAKKRFYRNNEQIRVPNVRVIDEDGTQVGILSTLEALSLAREKDLDLVEISPLSNPPVCKIMDFDKFRYQLVKREKQAKKKQHVVHVKEIRLSPNIEAHDFEFKVKQARKFIGEGNKVKLNMRFRGRLITHTELGVEVLDRFSEAVSDIAEVDGKPSMEGRRNMVMVLVKK
ncbi:translation initiation factor IF-3 [candidate division KSB1 bacterium]|nr:translation initiation factor IF-3 [candidate division KSB1 bacterium]